MLLTWGRPLYNTATPPITCIQRAEIPSFLNRPAGKINPATIIVIPNSPQARVKAQQHTYSPKPSAHQPLPFKKRDGREC